MSSQAALTTQMQQQGIRRLRIISGEAQWCWQQALAWQAALSGETIVIGTPSPPGEWQYCAPSAMKNLLGQEFQHAIFDARDGFHAEAFAAVAGTLRAGGWLQIMLPEWSAWPTLPDSDSLRWCEQAQAIATPHFVRHLKHTFSDAEVLLHRQKETPSLPHFPDRPRWQCAAPQQQQAILQQLLAQPAGVAVLTAARGRGKSALAGMLAQQQRCVVTAPAKVSTTVLAQFAGAGFNFQAPDALLASTEIQAEWLIIDEAAAIPAPLLTQLIARFQRVLLVTTVQGYEGTGRGFLLKFCAGLTRVRYFTLDEPLRWAREDPLERLVDRALLFSDAPPIASAQPWRITPLARHGWQTHGPLMQNLYRLLTSAHYRTSPLDLRRMMDAPGMRFMALHHHQQVAGALWLVREGGLSAALVDAIWAGWRRPRGNLVAQSLAAHADSPQAAMLTSLRVSRIAIEASQRQQGWGSRLLAAARASNPDVDFLSVSFGYTDDLWRFWHRNGFELVRIGSHREASSGCYAAMAVLPLSAAGHAMLQHARARFQRDWPLLQPGIALTLPCEAADQRFNDDDWREIAGFAFASRPFEVSLPALARLLAHSETAAPLLRARIVQKQAVSEGVASQALGGARQRLMKWRQEAAEALRQHDSARATEWQERLQSMQ